ncbi:ribonuclease HII [Candidatus Sumerlaeota bacterium]|nr:ribonuclease HII [Candidatus Sumerlaeota bacterium]
MSFFAGLDGVLSAGLEPESLECALADVGAHPVVCLDEAGRGPLAGPVVAGAVVFMGPCDIEGVGDSKRLSRDRRAALVPVIQGRAAAWAVAEASAEEIDEINILEATRLAARRAIEALGVEPAVVLTDALTLSWLTCPVVPIVKGDARVRGIGAASILAKEHRDALMRRLAEQWPQYGLDEHFGYPTPLHRERIVEHGPSTIHRLTFRGAVPGDGQALIHSRLFQEMSEALATASPEERRRLRRRVQRQGDLPRREREELLRRCAD